MLDFFSTNNIFFTVPILNYSMSHIEFWGTLLNILAVWLSAKENIWNWGIGMLSVVLFFYLFFQVNLYPDMSLQVFFFITNAIGWWQWANPKVGFENKQNELKITKTKPSNLFIISLLGLLSTCAMGYSAANLHQWFPQLFSQPSAFPYLDSFTTVLSVLTTFLLIQKKVESWWIWLVIDVVSTYIYWQKGIKFVSFIYFIYCFIALYGAINWQRQYRKELGSA